MESPVKVILNGSPAGEHLYVRIEPSTVAFVSREWRSPSKNATVELKDRYLCSITRAQFDTISKFLVQLGEQS